MASIQVTADVDLDEPVLVEGLPGAGLVGKIAADHLVQSLEMEFFAAVHCEGLPQVAVYRGERSDVRPPVRLYADEARDLLVLQSDVPVSPTQAPGFASCVTDWLQTNEVLPLFVSGLSEEQGASPEIYGIATGDAEGIVDDAGLVPPRDSGMVTGPTGALLYTAGERDMDAVGLIVQTEGQFPDPEAARTVLEHGVEPIAGVSVDTDVLMQQADEIQQARQTLAKRLREADDDESSRAEPIRGFQ